MNNNLLKMQFYALSRLSLNIPNELVHSELKELYGENAPSLSTVTNWLNNFRFNSTSVDSVQSGDLFPNDHLTNKSKTSSDSLREYETNVNTLIQDYTQQIKKLIDENKEKEENHKRTLRKLIDENKELKDQLVLNENERTEKLSVENRELNLANLNLKQELNTLKLKQMINTDNAANSHLKHELDSLNLNYVEQINKTNTLSEQNEKMKARIDQLESELSCARLEELTNENLKLKKELLVDKMTHDKLVKEKVMLIESVKMLYSRICDYEKSLNTPYADQLVEDFHKCKSVLINKLSAVTLERETHQIELTKMRRELDERDVRVSELTAQVSRLKEEISRISSRYAALDFTDFSLNLKRQSK